MHECLRSCNGDKASQLNGFNMKFLQVFWHVIKDIVIEVFREMHENGKFVRSLNSTFLVLIAKKKGTKNV